MIRRIPVAVLGLSLAVLGLVIAGPLGLAGGKLDPVKIQAAAGKPDAAGNQTVNIEVNIEKGWHLYANPVGNEELAEAQTVVLVKAAGKTVPAKVKYPSGTPHTEKGVGTFKIYEDKVVISAAFPKTDGAVEVSVRFQACDDKRCLPPKTIKVKLP